MDLTVHNTVLLVIYGGIEFAKSRVMRASVVYVPKACQLLIFTCQRANKRVNVSKAFQFFNFTCQEACHFFNYFSKESENGA